MHLHEQGRVHHQRQVVEGTPVHQVRSWHTYSSQPPQVGKGVCQYPVRLFVLQGTMAKAVTQYAEFKIWWPWKVAYADYSAVLLNKADIVRWVEFVHPSTPSEVSVAVLKL